MVKAEILLGNSSRYAAICIKEDKNEIGDGSCDPSTQAGLSYGQFWAQKEVCVMNPFLFMSIILIT